MATTLRDFIAQRETEIRDLQKALKSELRDLQLAKAALGGATEAAAASTSGSVTIKEMARQVLAAQPNGLSSSGILDAIKKTFGRDIERTSLSPQLSRLKDENELVLNGDVWFAAEHSLPHQGFNDVDDDAPPSYGGGWGVPNARSRNPFDDDSEIPF